MEQLVKQVLENKNSKIQSAFLGDGSYDSNMRISNIYKIKRLNLQSRLEITLYHLFQKHHKIRNKEKSSFKRDLIMEEEKYGKRWMADETVFSSIKRMFGEYMYHSN